jgi:alkanesulfonate monooxygenase SsuD/methylene tetrahydromethanopterin reductase-like flavin-dependent oxidoreductase (luciferase family)
MSGETFSYAGTHYRVTGYAGRPLPVQRPCPPVLIGGGGKRVLTIAGQEADIVGINGTMHGGRIGPGTLGTMTAEAVDEKVGFVRAGAGNRFGEIEMNIRVFMSKVTDDRHKAIADLAAALGQSVDLLDRTPFALLGSSARIIEDLIARRERWGFSYIIVGPEEIDSFAPVVAELAGR